MFNPIIVTMLIQLKVVIIKHLIFKKEGIKVIVLIMIFKFIEFSLFIVVISLKIIKKKHLHLLC